MRLFAFGLIFSAFSLVAHAQAEPQRIVSVGGGVTEVLYRLGVQDRIVAVDTTSLYPAEALKTKPNVGYLRALSAEGVLGLAPDLIILDGDAGPPEAVAILEQAKIPLVRVPTGHRVGELPEKIRKIADAVGKKQEGEEMAGKVVSDLAALENDLKRVATKKKVLFILSLVDGRPMAAGTETGADGIIRIAGAENVFGSVKGYKTISPEAAAALQPEAILMITRSSAPLEGNDILKQPAFSETPAAKTNSFFKMDGLYLLGFGPRTAEAARELAAGLYPDLGLKGSH